MCLVLKMKSSESQNKKIKLVGETGTQNILDLISDNCKIIFPSTHVVFEGIDKVFEDINENEETTCSFILLIKSI